MALKEIAVEGLTISHSTGSNLSGGSFTITSTPSIKVKAEGKGIYRGTLNFSFSGGTYAGGVSSSATGSGSINFTATKTKADGQFVLRKDDSGTVSGTYQVPPPPPGVTSPFTASVEISDANQTKVKAE
jgi:hypothetical protein